MSIWNVWLEDLLLSDQSVTGQTGTWDQLSDVLTLSHHTHPASSRHPPVLGHQLPFKSGLAPIWNQMNTGAGERTQLCSIHCSEHLGGKCCALLRGRQTRKVPWGWPPHSPGLITLLSEF